MSLTSSVVDDELNLEKFPVKVVDRISEMDHQHQFKRSSEGLGCCFCNDLWPSVDGLVSKYQHCELCGKFKNNLE